jgi:hypothetical protein
MVARRFVARHFFRFGSTDRSFFIWTFHEPESGKQPFFQKLILKTKNKPLKIKHFQKRQKDLFLKSCLAKPRLTERINGI